jgi:predicted transcriptional regulator
VTETDLQRVVSVLDRRRALLGALGREPTPVADVRSALGIPRSTLDRGIDDLTDLGFAERTREGVCRTLAGRLAAEELDRFEDRLAGASDARPVLEMLPPTADLPVELFEDAEVRRARDDPAGRFCELLEAAASADAIGNGVHARVLETYVRRLETGEFTADVVLTEQALGEDAARHHSRIGDAVSTGRHRLRRTDEEVPYTLALLELPERTLTAVFVHGLDDGAEGLLVSDSPAVASWARERFETVWAAADPLSPESAD